MHASPSNIRSRFTGTLVRFLLSIRFIGCLLPLQAAGQSYDLTQAFDHYRSQGDKNTFEWTAIRNSAVQPDSIVASIIRDIQNETHGYIVYPPYLGNIFRLVEDEDARKAIRHLGYLQSPPSAVPKMIRECAYTPWLFGNELLTPLKDAANSEALDRFFAAANEGIKVRQALWYYFHPTEPEQKLPVPTAENLFFFQGQAGDYDRIEALLASGKQGYIICPVWTEDITGSLDSPELHPEVKASGLVEFLVTENPFSIALNFNVWQENTSDYSEADLIPFVYDTGYEQQAADWLVSVKELYPETIRSFYCYFDHRKPEEIAADQAAGNCVAPVFREDGLSSEAKALADRFARQKNALPAVIPYWMEDVYLKLPSEAVKKISRLEYMGCSIDPTTNALSLLSDWQREKCLPDRPPFLETPFDLLILFRGEQHTTRFLKSKDEQMTLITKLFSEESGLLSREPALRPIDGITLYFPDYNFKNKRNFVQFIKSVCFVIDSFCVDGKKIYGNYDLTVTLPIPAKQHIRFLSILLKYKLVDRLCFVNYDNSGLPVTNYPLPDNPEGPDLQAVTYEGEYDSSLLDNLWNSLCYLLDPNPFDDELSGCSDDLEKLADTQFSAPVLLYLICAFLTLCLTLVVLVVLYFTYSKFYIYAQRRQRYIVPVVLTLFSEILLILYLITNVVSTRETYNIWTQLFILAIPFVFFLLAATPFIRHEREPLP